MNTEEKKEWEYEDDLEQTQESIDQENELRRLTHENADTSEVLAQKARDAPSGFLGDRHRALFGTCWLTGAYEISENSNVPRQEMYEQYKRHCESHNVQPTNTAFFGKMVRSLWPDLKTRRLGTRGQSRYNYCGIRKIGLNASTPFEQLKNYGSFSNFKEEALAKLQPLILKSPNDQLQNIASEYILHCQQIIDLIQEMEFQSIENVMKQYWKGMQEHRLIMNNPEVVEIIWRGDVQMYDAIISKILPSPLRRLPIKVTQAIRHFARKLESWILGSMEGYNSLLVARRVDISKVFTAQLKRHTSLGFLAVAAAQVLENVGNVHSMFMEWSKLDFDGIGDQSGWVTECRKMDFTRVAETEVKNLLNSAGSLEEWTRWLESIVSRFVNDKLDQIKYIAQSKMFLLKWTYYGNQCMRDLTLRSVEIFGAFHILRSFLDEYLLFTLEQRISRKK